MQRIATVLICVCILGGAYMRFARLRGQGQFVTISERDSEMSAAIAAARKSLPDLLQALREGVDYYAVKVPIVDGGETEHFWLSEVQHVDGAFSGVIDNDPVTVRTVKAGDRFSVRENEISDWLYVRNGVATGNRTLLALFPWMSQAAVAEAKHAMGWK